MHSKGRHSFPKRSLCRSNQLTPRCIAAPTCAFPASSMLVRADFNHRGCPHPPIFRPPLPAPAKATSNATPSSCYAYDRAPAEKRFGGGFMKLYRTLNLISISFLAFLPAAAITANAQTGSSTSASTADKHFVTAALQDLPLPFAVTATGSAFALLLSSNCFTDLITWSRAYAASCQPFTSTRFPSRSL
jgi:hypothetical protein